MKRNTRNPFFNPFAAWTDLAWKIGEMSVASARVIAHRTTRMAAAGPLPNARDRQEFTRMGQEKIDAASESVHAIVAHMTAANCRIGPRALGQMMAATAALMSLAASRNAGQFVVRQVKLAQTMSRSAMTASTLSGSAAGLAARGLRPIHSRATANARRLGKR